MIFCFLYEILLLGGIISPDKSNNGCENKKNLATILSIIFHGHFNPDFIHFSKYFLVFY